MGVCRGTANGGLQRPNIWGFAEALLTGFGCITTTHEGLVTDLCQADRERLLPKPNINTSD